MSLSLGIVGLPNVGKSTLFNALTHNNVLAANYPFATIEPNEGVVPLPDPRLEKLAEMFGSERILPAPVTFVDIAGIVKGASEGAGLGNKFLANIRECDAICQVVRVFADDDVVHVDGKVDPRADIEVIETELILADMQTLEKALPRLEKEARNNKERKPVHEAAVAAQAVLDSGTTLFAAGSKVDSALLRELNLLTTKPFLYVFNADESVLGDEAKISELRAAVAPADAVFLDAKIESELQELDDESAAELLESIGQTERGLDALARDLQLPRPKRSWWQLLVFVGLIALGIGVAISLIKSGRKGWGWALLAALGVILFFVLRAAMSQSGGGGAFGGGSSGGGGATGSW